MTDKKSRRKWYGKNELTPEVGHRRFWRRSRTPSPVKEEELTIEREVDEAQDLSETQGSPPPSYASVQEETSVIELQVTRSRRESETLISGDETASGDTQRTIDRYHNSLQELKEALRYNPTFAQDSQAFETVDTNDPLILQKQINKIFEARQVAAQTPSRWGKYKSIVESVYKAISPFMRTLADLGSNQVNPYGIAFQGLFILLSIADRALDRSRIEQQLDYISRQLAQLHIVEDLPNVTISCQSLINNAIDVRTCVFSYLAIQIRHEANRMSVIGVTPSSQSYIGKIAGTLRAGDQEVKARGDLETAIQRFNASLSHFGHGVTFQMYDQVEGIRRDLNFLTTSQPPQFTPERFIVPYEENPHFVGRKSLLQTLHEKLHEFTPQAHNYRVALHGLGGAGKTQTTLAYVYAHKSEYDAIYWLPAVNQANLLSAYTEMGRRTGAIRYTGDSTLEDSARSVIGWLRGQTNWLVVIDNLDDVSAVDGFLPPAAEGKYTIITTRNPNVLEIPAKGLEVGILDPDDAVELLLVRADLSSTLDEKTRDEANKIVQELGYLALAIEQASAYIRTTSRNIFKFLPSYRHDRRRHHHRIPRGNWKYSKAVATTWRMSFEQIEENSKVASGLLRLLSFLNPDGILLDFLRDGKEGLEGDLRLLAEDEDLLYEGLDELGRFSLIRRQDGEEEMITIHRLVQSVVKDEMDEAEYTALRTSAIGLCNAAFPTTWETEDLRLVCRKYQEQIIPAMSDIKPFPSPDFQQILSLLGHFLHDYGKYREAEEIQQKALEVSTLVHDPDDPAVLDIMANLAETYRSQSQRDKAIELQETVVEKRAKVLGDDHLDTWAARGDLAATYRSKGRRQEAEEIQLQVLDARIRKLGEDHPETLRGMGNLAATYRKNNRPHQALKLQERVLSKRMKNLGRDHPDTQRAMLNVAVTLKFVANQNPETLERAGKLEMEVIEAWKKMFGPTHPQTLTATRNLADTYFSQGRSKEAGELLEVVVEGRKQVLGEDNPDTLWAMSGLAGAYRLQGRLSEAVCLQERVLQGRRALLGDKHVDVNKAMKQLAKTYGLLGRTEEQSELSRRLKESDLSE